VHGSRRLRLFHGSGHGEAPAVGREIARRGLVAPLVKGWLLGVFKLGTYWTCYTWLPKFLQNQGHQSITRSALWIVTAQAGQLLGMMGFGFFADRYGRRRSYTVYSLVTAGALYPLAFYWNDLLPHPFLFWTVLFTLGLGSGCTAGFGALLAELFPTEVRNFAMGTTYNCARGVQFFAPILVSLLVADYGLRGGLGLPMCLALGTAMWVWTLPETRDRDLAAISSSLK
jgi:MFS family permease